MCSGVILWWTHSHSHIHPRRRQKERSPQLTAAAWKEDFLTCFRLLAATALKLHLLHLLSCQKLIVSKRLQLLLRGSNCPNVQIHIHSCQ